MSETKNPLMDMIRIPGETFRLPSHGLFYQNGELDPSVKNGEVEVYPMTALDEIILSTPDKLLSGKAIVEVITRCVPQVLKPGQLLAKDVDFLMVCLRLSSFGNDLEILYDHACSDDSHEHTYVVDLQNIINNAKIIDPTTLNQNYTIKMPNGQIVHLRPIVYQDIVDIYQTTTLQANKEITEESAKWLILNTLSSVIKQVDDVTNKDQIVEWLSHIRLGWKKKIQQAIHTVSDWGVDMKSSQICKDCGQPITLSVSANPVSFFT